MFGSVCGGRGSLLPVWAAVLGMALLGACVMPSDKGANGSGTLSVNNLDLSPRMGRAGGTGAAGGGGATEVIYFDADGNRRAAAPGVNPADDGYTVNLQGVTVEAAAQSVLADALGAAYVVDPGVSGSITMTTGAPVRRDQVLRLFEEALSANGLTLRKQDGTYRIAQGGGSEVTANMEAEGYGITAIPLRNLKADRMMALLDGFAATEGNLRAAPEGDILLLRGTQQERDDLVELVSSLDVDLLARSNAGIAFLQNASAASVQDDLLAVQQNDPSTAGWKTQVLDRANALLVQARNRDDLDSAMTWIKRLDRAGGGAQSGLHVYKVQFARASQLADLLTATLGSGGGAAAPAQAKAPADATGGPPAEMAAAGGDMGTAAPDGGATTVAAATGVSGNQDIRFAANDADNTIIIMAPPPVRQQALALLAELDRAPVQVLIDVMLIEVTLNDATRMGVQAYLQNSRVGLIGTAGDGPGIDPNFPGLNLILGPKQSPRMIIDSLSQVTKVKVVSAPSVAAFENEQAEIKVVEQVPIVTQQVVGTQAPDSPVVNSVEYRDAGVILRVTPQVSETNLVNLQVRQELSAVVGDSTSGATLTPTLRERSITTRVAVYDRQTVALGGLISQQTSKDKRGGLFGILGGRKADENARTELVVFITPHVVRNQRDAASMSDELRRKMTMMAQP